MIDRDALLGPMKLQEEALKKIGPTLAATWYGNAIWEIEQAPRVVDAVPVRRGRWIEDDATYPGPGRSNYICSECKKCGGTWRKGLKTESLFAYCPWCGADMREGEKDG